MKPSFALRSADTYTDRYVVTFRDDDNGAGLEMLREKAGLHDFVRARDFSDRAVPHESAAAAKDGTMFDDLNMCVVNCPTTAAERIASFAPASAILAIEPDHQIFAIGPEADVAGSPSPHFLDTGRDSWGIEATKANASRFTGRGIDVAVLDTGIDATHPDLNSGNLQQQRSFLFGSDANDRNGHGTHCSGVIVGNKDPTEAPQYGVAVGVNLYVGKVLDGDGTGSVRSILAGLNWAIAQRCHVVSMSVGADIRSPAMMFEEAGRRALKAGTMVVAAAGNNADRQDKEWGFVTRPANSRFVMAVGAVDRELQLANFSVRSSFVEGGAVDIVAPGVEVFSAWPGRERYRSISGTSMATPFVAGIAALYAEAFGIRGDELWKRLIEEAKSLPSPTVDAGAGLVQAI